MTHKIPDSFRPAARARAARLLSGITDEKQADRIINQIAAGEWELDRAEWRQWMNGMRRKFESMHATPFDRVAAERKERK